MHGRPAASTMRRCAMADMDEEAIGHFAFRRGRSASLFGKISPYGLRDDAGSQQDAACSTCFRGHQISGRVPARRAPCAAADSAADTSTCRLHRRGADFAPFLARASGGERDGHTPPHYDASRKMTEMSARADYHTAIERYETTHHALPSRDDAAGKIGAIRRARS